MNRLRNTIPALLSTGLMMAGCGGQKPMTPVVSSTTSTIALRPDASGAAITTFVLPAAFSRPANIVTGPDQALWFTESGKIARISATGALREFALPAGHTASSLTTGPDGALWFTEPEASAIGRITTAGVITELIVPGACQAGYACPTSPRPIGIVTGSDNALWIIEPIFSRVSNRTAAAKVLRLTTDGTFTEFPIPGGSAKSTTPNPRGVARGPDGAVWFTDSFERLIWRVTTSGVLTSFPSGSGAPSAITAGPDGALWFTAVQLGRITTTGAVVSLAVPSGPNGTALGAIAAGADGNLWLTAYDLTRSGGAIVRSTTAGAKTTTAFPTYTEIDGITRGPDNAIWFTQMDNQTGASKIGRIAVL
jgi:virginiamycin B lyase